MESKGLVSFTAVIVFIILIMAVVKESMSYSKATSIINQSGTITYYEGGTIIVRLNSTEFSEDLTKALDKIAGLDDHKLFVTTEYQEGE